LGKFKPKWQKTNIPKDIKIILWRVMRDNPVFPKEKRDQAIPLLILNKETEERLHVPSRDTWKSLQEELNEMPIEEVTSLPQDLQDWISQLRPDLKHRNDLEEHWKTLAGAAEELAVSLRYIIRRYSPMRNKTIGGLSADEDQFEFLEFLDDPPAGFLLSHLKAELPELKTLDKWRNLQIGDITEKLLLILSVKAVQKEFQGKCKICENWVSH